MATQSTGGRSGGGRGKFKQANKQLIDSVSPSMALVVCIGPLLR